MTTPPRQRLRSIKPVNDDEAPMSDTIELLLPDQDMTGDSTPEPAAEAPAVPQAPETAAAPPKPERDDSETRRAAIVPAPFQRGQRLQTAKDFAELSAYRAGFHGLRAPFVYAPGSVLYATRGAARLGGRWGKWVTVPELKLLEHAAVAKGHAGHAQAMQAHITGNKTRKDRLKATGACAVVAGLTSAAAAAWVPWEFQYGIAAAAYGVLVHQGRPLTGPMIPRAILPAAYQVPSLEVIQQALDDIGIPKLTAYIKATGRIDWVIDLYPDGDGWSVEFDAPKGVTAKQIIQKRAELSSALRRPISAVWPKAVPGEHEGRVHLWIGRRDFGKMKPQKHPLLKAGTADFFTGVPFGYLPWSEKVLAPLFETNWLIVAAMGGGKTAAIRTLLSGAALDTLCDIWVHEHSGKGDLEPFAQVCHRYTSGVDDEAIAYTAESFRKLRKEVEKRQKIWKQIPGELKPNGSLTRDLAAADKRLRPIVVVVDECHNAFQHPQYGDQIATDMEFVMRLGRAYGIVIVLATQRNGAGSIPPIISAVITVRFCLKVNDQTTNDMALGTGMYSAGYNAVIFRREINAGMGWLLGGKEPCAPKTWYVNIPDAKRVSSRGRLLREKAGTLSGYALGLDDSDEPRDLLDDVLSLYGPRERHLYWETIAKRLAERYPAYTAITPDAASSQVREAAGMAESDEAREPRGPNRAGAKKLTIEAAASSSAAVREAAAAARDDMPSVSPETDVTTELLVAAAELVITSQFATTAMLQRKLRVGNVLAADLMGALHDREVVGDDPGGDKTRTVLKRPEALSEVLTAIRESANATA